MLCWVLWLLVSPTVSPLAPGVSAGEGVVAFGLSGCGFGVGASAGVGVAVTGPGCGFGRGWSLGVAGRGCSPLLAEGLVGLPLCPRGLSGGPAAPLAGCCWVLVLRVFVCCVQLWCGRCSGFGVWCASVELVSVAAVAVCVVCARGRVCGVLVVRLGACPRLSGLWFGGPVWVRGLCVVAPLPPRLWGPGAGPRCPWLGFVAGGVSPRPFACPPPSYSLPRRLGQCSPNALPGPTRLWWVGGEVLDAPPFPWCFPLGGAMLALPVRV